MGRRDGERGNEWREFSRVEDWRVVVRVANAEDYTGMVEVELDRKADPENG